MVQTRRRGPYTVSAIGFGAMPLAWELSPAEHVVRIRAARRSASITDSAKAVDLELSEDEIARCSATAGLH